MQNYVPGLQRNFGGKRNPRHAYQPTGIETRMFSKYHYCDYGHYFQFSTNQSGKRNGYQKLIIILSVFTLPPSLLLSNTLDTHLSTKCSDVLNVASLDSVVEGLSTEGVGSRVVAADDGPRRGVGAVVLVRAGALSNLIELSVQCAGRILRCRRHEDYLRISLLSHLLHRLKVSDLHSGCRAQDIGSLAHQLRRLDFGARGDDLGFTSTLALRGHGQRVLQVLAEDDVLDQHALDGGAPAGGGLFDDLADRLRDFLAALDYVLEHARADDVAEGGLRALDEGLADVGDAEGGFVGGGDVVVDDGGELEVDVVCLGVVLASVIQCYRYI